jgi:superfamily II RNA helicase
MDYVDVREGECTNRDECEFFPNRGYEWDDFQKHSFNAIDSGNNLLVLAPTASGKTVVAEYAILKHLNQNNNLNTNNKVVFTSPIKSLSLEKYSDFKELCKGLDVMPGILTGDNKENLDSPLIVATTEIIRNSLYRLKEESLNPDNVLDNKFIDEMTCIIIDEAHYINDESRGGVWEEVLTLLNPNVQIVMLSATINNPEGFASWVGGIKQKTITVVKKYIRPVPLAYYIYDGKKINMICDNDSNFDNSLYDTTKSRFNDYYGGIKYRDLYVEFINSIIKYCRDNDLLQTIFFVFSIAKCEEYSSIVNVKLLDYYDSARAVQEFVNRIKPFKKEYELLPIYDKIKDLISKGVCYHHSELPPIMKEIIQSMFKDGFIKLLFATETFAVGVNMPVRTVILTSLMKYSNNGLRILRPDEFKQICGRAGRRGKDTFGRAILIPLHSFYRSHDIKDLIYGSMPIIKSKMELGYNMFLKLKQSMIMDNNSFFSKTLMKNQNVKQIESLKNKIDKLEKIKSELSKIDDPEIEKKIKTYLKLQNINSGKESFNGFRVKMSNKDRKKFRTMKMFYENNKELFEKYNEYNDVTNKITQINDQIYMLSDGIIEEEIKKYSKFLTKYGYLDDNSNLTAKGVIATQINECDSAPLAVFIFDTIMSDNSLTSQEIVAILSCLLDKTRIEKEEGLVLGDKLSKIDISVLKHTNEYENKGCVNCTDGVREVLKKVMNFIEDVKQCESSLCINNRDCWRISLGYVELSYRWSSGEDIRSVCKVLEDINEGMGTFIKNMIKISNILNDFKHIVTSINKLEFIEVLDCAIESIIRGVVNNFSIHLLE